jgi:uncharacterized protein (DUF433 family)
MKYHDLIVRDPAICGGEPTPRGTRVALGTVLAGLAGGSRIGAFHGFFRHQPLTTRQLRPSIEASLLFHPIL